MKLILNRIQSDFAVGKAMFILYIVGTVLSVFVFIYFYGNFKPALEDFKEAIGNVSLRTYTVDADEPFQITPRCVSMLEGYDVEKFSISSTYTASDDEYGITITAVMSNEDIKDILNDYYDGHETPKLSDKEFSSNIILIGEEAGYTEPTITINGTEFKVITTKNNYEYIMPLEPFLKQGFETYSYSFVLRERLKTSDNYKLIGTITSQLNEEYSREDFGVSDPLSVSADNGINEIFTYFLQLCLIYLVCFISCAFLFNYIFKRNLYENVIYMIIGAKKRLIFLVAVVEVALLSIASSAIACALHAALYESVFTKVNNYIVRYTFTDYLIITGFVTLLSVVIMLPFFISTIQRTSIDLKNKYI